MTACHLKSGFVSQDERSAQARLCTAATGTLQGCRPAAKSDGAFAYVASAVVPAEVASGSDGTDDVERAATEPARIGRAGRAVARVFPFPDIAAHVEEPRIGAFTRRGLRRHGQPVPESRSWTAANTITAPSREMRSRSVKRGAARSGTSCRSDAVVQADSIRRGPFVGGHWSSRQAPPLAPPTTPRRWDRSAPAKVVTARFNPVTTLTAYPSSPPATLPLFSSCREARRSLRSRRRSESSRAPHGGSTEVAAGRAADRGPSPRSRRGAGQ